MTSVYASGRVTPVPGSAGKLQGYIQDRRVIGVRTIPLVNQTPLFSFLTRFLPV